MILGPGGVPIVVPGATPAAGGGGSDAGLITGKGSLLAGTAAGALADLPVGADGTIPVADSTQAKGIRWGAPAGAVSYAFPWEAGTDAPTANALVGAPFVIGGMVGWVDLSGFTQAQFVANVNTAWSAGTVMRPQFSTDAGTNWAYLENAGTGFEVPVAAATNSPANLAKSAAYVAMAAAALGQVHVRLVLYGNGAGVIAGRLRTAWLVCK